MAITQRAVLGKRQRLKLACNRRQRMVDQVAPVGPPPAQGHFNVSRWPVMKRPTAGGDGMTLAATFIAYRAYLARADDPPQGTLNGRAFCRMDGCRISTGSSLPPVSIRSGSLVGMSERQARRLVWPLVDRGLPISAKDAPLRIAFPLGESKRLFPHLWAPASVAMALDLPPDADDARAPRAA
jgi:hypothetical protein